VKLETMALLAGAGYLGWYLAKKKAKIASTAAPVTTAPEPPQVVERVYIEEYPVYDYPYPYPGGGYPIFFAGRGGGRRHRRPHRGPGRGGGGGGRRGRGP